MSELTGSSPIFVDAVETFKGGPAGGIPYQDLLHYYGTENLFCGNLFDRDFNIVILMYIKYYFKIVIFIFPIK
ncbi:hypothetical protein Avbf_11216 [Armadillidium vulgare]|nr:hypothetical protein Avbf_11216 [Armadillidium vulgare]